MFDGYLSFAGTEIGNVQRLYTYAEAELPNLLTTCDCDCDLLAQVLGDGAYTTPVNDMAPWVDPEDPATWGFYGVMPLSVSGLQNSTHEYQIEESIGNGGVIGRRRYRSLEFRVTAMLAARDEEALEAGYAWLKAVADGSCGGPCGTGMQFCYLSSCPTDLTDVGAPQTQELQVYSTLPRSNGPRETGGISYTSRIDPPLPCGEIRWTLQLEVDPNWVDPDTDAVTGVAEVGATEVGAFDTLEPGEAELVVMSAQGAVHSVRVQVDEQVRDYVITDTGEGTGPLWVQVNGGALLRSAQVTANTGDVVQACADTFLRQLHNVVVSDGVNILTDHRPSSGGALRVVEMTFTAMSPRTFRNTIQVAEVDRGMVTTAPGVQVYPLDYELPLCEQEEETWREVLANPKCPLDPPPPLPPATSGACLPLTHFSAAYEIDIPQGVVPEWTEMVPTLTVKAGGQAIHSVRVRFLANPLGLRAQEIDPCAECASYSINYIPRGVTMTVDGTVERAYVTSGQQTFNARQALYSTRAGSEFTWPVLACGVGYLAVVEIAADSDVEELTLSLTARE